MAGYLSYDELSVALSYCVAMGGPSSTSPAPSVSLATPPAPPAEDDIFADVADVDETDEEKAATLARRKRMEDARKMKEAKDLAAGKKKDKEKPAEKSLVVLEVKPWEATCDLKEVWKKIVEYKQEGLTWGEAYKLEPVAYGIMKLVLTCTIVDKLVVMDDITDNIEAMEDFVQSVQVVSMNKV
mmetsp:Transcript_25154/g.25353  ORF Transcript_25154/g.25353 Transcript_25154/m.25353 type:complete len:184 (-) Transcript_25154:167-718(-)|eukprot:CAMPEP_0182428028 /NCGR_PEP_ID=MMETSP1167-20130531/20964_1 /TAXON_ID=2988 /ORGANISM="Mallomonas Sp, Strain CCMP3275" /LENGTH=183 /DNA_ID=CAMNT_0024610659 /DNA_START=43 /DNA_END=594 /DNA_ORIENTATION=+